MSKLATRFSEVRPRQSGLRTTVGSIVVPAGNLARATSASGDIFSPTKLRRKFAQRLDTRQLALIYSPALN